ncbi:MAG TPA: hypothetical protein VGD60_00460 [Candidatus Acidoferrales bacterium]
MKMENEAGQAGKGETIRQLARLKPAATGGSTIWLGASDRAGATGEAKLGRFWPGTGKSRKNCRLEKVKWFVVLELRRNLIAHMSIKNFIGGDEKWDLRFRVGVLRSALIRGLRFCLVDGRAIVFVEAT